jgi:hypothetical protein
MEASNRPSQIWTHWSCKSLRGYRNKKLVVIQPPPGYKRPPTLQAEGAEEYFPLSLSELFELSAHPIITLFFFFNTKNVGRKAITS